MVADWRHGVGTYVGDDVSTYIVKDSDGKFVVGFVVGSTVGDGSATREVSRRSGKMVVTIRRGRGDAPDLPEIELEQNMTGWWKPGGEVFSTEEPARIDTRPARKTRPAPVVPVQTAPVVATPPTSSNGQPQLPDRAVGLVTNLVAEYTIGRGPSGVVLLFKGSKVIVPDNHPQLFGNLLASRYRFALLRELRNAPSAVELEEVLYTVPSQTGQPLYRKHAKLGDQPGWYWREDGQPDKFIVDAKQSLRLSAAVERLQGWEMAANNGTATVRQLLGVVTSAEHVYPRARTNNDLELLVACQRGQVREFTLLFGLAESTTPGAKRGLALVSYRVENAYDGGMQMITDGRTYHKPPYAVAFDTKGKARIFKRP